MRILVLSDIHANVTAFEAVLADAAGDWDQLWCLGDVVGYGPDPNECVALLQEQPHVALCGNHDWASLGRVDLDIFNPIARSAIEWTRRQLTDASRTYLESLEPLRVEHPFTLAHASPREPIWEYITDARVARANMAHFDTPYCLVGHTHVPVIFYQQDSEEIDMQRPSYGRARPLDGGRYIINPGGVGQPRDGDPRAAYAILDTDALTWEHRRVAYDVLETQSRMADHKLPAPLVARLQYGY
jgi:diadenosine tetraphosphatase ApaH/serine/threonine PP2A family protein phosphatase